MISVKTSDDDTWISSRDELTLCFVGSGCLPLSATAQPHPSFVLIDVEKYMQVKYTTDTVCQALSVDTELPTASTTTIGLMLLLIFVQQHAWNLSIDIVGTDPTECWNPSKCRKY